MTGMKHQVASGSIWGSDISPAPSTQCLDNARAMAELLGKGINGHVPLNQKSYGEVSEYEVPPQPSPDGVGVPLMTTLGTAPRAKTPKFTFAVPKTPSRAASPRMRPGKPLYKCSKEDLQS